MTEPNTGACVCQLLHRLAVWAESARGLSGVASTILHDFGRCVPALARRLLPSRFAITLILSAQVV